MTLQGMGYGRDLHLATVLDNQDSESRGRVRVRLHATGMEAWACVMVPSAGNGYGVSFLPRKDEHVILAFLGPDQPVVLGSLWSGSDAHPSEAVPVEDKYLIRTPSGIQILLDDSSPKLSMETPAGYHLTIDDGGSGTVTIEKGSESIEMSSEGITITSSVKVKVEAGQVEVSAGMVKVDAGMSKFSGVVQCDTLIANSVVSSSYTPGAGNIW